MIQPTPAELQELVAAHFARCTSPIDLAIARQYQVAATAGAIVEASRCRVQLLERFKWRVPLHEWAEAKRRGGLAVYQLLGAYAPGNAASMERQGLTPRCPPWAARRYREEARRTLFKGCEAGAICSKPPRP